MKPSPPRFVVDQSYFGPLVSTGDLPRLWGRRGFWQIRLRWAVAPLMITGVILGRALGFEFDTRPILAIAIASLVYNSFFAWIYSRFKERLAADPELDHFFTLLEVVADYGAMFLLLHYTGGISSPLVPFLLFHLIIAAVQFSPATAYSLASTAAAGLWLIYFGELLGWIPSHGLKFRGQPLHFMDRPVYAAIWLAFFTATLFLTAAMVSRVMGRLRQGVADLARTTSELATLNIQLNGLYAMVGAIGAERHLQPILDLVTSEMTRVMRVPAASIKLLSDEGKTLRFVSTQGLPKELVVDTVIELDRSPLNRRVIEGETLVQTVLPSDDPLQLGQALVDLGFQSAAFAPLAVEDGVIGTLGVYGRRPDRFDPNDISFLELAAKLVAIAIEDARVNEEIEELMADRTRFMLQVAHNLRAPLSAGLSMMDLLEQGYMGDVSERQKEYLHRIEERLRSLNQMIGQLLTIAQTRDRTRDIPDVVIDMAGLAAQTERMLQDEVAGKNLSFEVEVGPDLPTVDSGADLLEQVMSNLISNAVKYTPEGGRIAVSFRRQDQESVEIRVADTGIGIPREEQSRLFQEFFRASNAKQHTTAGTGLGLALVKQTVERHHGDIQVISDEGAGTEVLIRLPIHQPGSALS